MATVPSFGKEIMSKEFLLDSNFAFINHGSFGTAPRRVLEHRLRLIEQQEHQPDIWFRELCDKMWSENLETVCQFLGARRENLMFVANTTTGTNAVLRSLKLKPGDAVLTHSYTYFAVRNTCNYVANCKGLQVLTVDIPYPLTSVEQLLNAYEQALNTHPNIKLVTLDYIASIPPIFMPLNELIAICRRHNALVFVDGAHTPGQIDLDLENLGAHFYTANLHKWAFAARGCAVLWVHPDFHQEVFPVVTSKYDVENWERNFSYQGTNDNTQYYTVNTALKFREDIGGSDAIFKYNTELVTKAADLLVAKWNTKHYPIPDELRAPFMRQVRLPDLKKRKIPILEEKLAANDRVDLMYVLRHRFGLQTLCVEINNEPWIRISAMVYNCMDDYEKLADAILMLKSEDEDSNKQKAQSVAS